MWVSIFLYLLFSSVFSTLCEDIGGIRINDTFNKGNVVCIKLFEDVKFWYLSEIYCQKWEVENGLTNGHLVSIQNSEMNDAIFELINSNFLYWIGIGDFNLDEVMDDTWTDSSIFNYSNFNEHSPSNIVMASISKFDNGKWYGYSIDEIYMFFSGNYFICKSEFGKTSDTFCSGIPSSSESVCKGHGICINGECECYDNYYGSNCQVFHCINGLNNETGNCSGNGVCNDIDTCECDMYHNGTNCENKIVNPCDLVGGKTFNDTCIKGFDAEFPLLANLRCSEWGDLIGADATLVSIHSQEVNDFICEQFPFDALIGWIMLSDYPIENWIDGTSLDFENWDDQVFEGVTTKILCSIDGKWDYYENGYGDLYNAETKYSYICSFKMPELDKCFGYTNYHPDKCSGHGDCIEGKCECNELYYGENCEIWSCFNHFNNESNTICNSSGECLDHDVCNCESGWKGEECKIRTCGGIEYTSDIVCNGHGVCDGPNHCTCYEDERIKYFGELCVLYSYSYSPCTKEGGFNLNDKCIISFSAENDVFLWQEAEYICQRWGENTVGLKNGHLVSIHSSEEEDFLCDIVNNDGTRYFIGVGSEDYEKKESSGILTWADGTEVDFTNWVNPDYNFDNICESSLNCEEREWSTSYFSCSYNDYPSGFFCQAEVEGLIDSTWCYGIPSSSSLVCTNGLGYCKGNDTCDCSKTQKTEGDENDWENDYSRFYSSNFIYLKCEENADPIWKYWNYGNFGDSNHWKKIVCNVKSVNNTYCGEYTKYHPDHCNVHGDCVSTDFCDCWDKDIYSGDLCEKWKCFDNYNFEKEKVCSNNGDCIDFNTCDCYEERVGDECESWTCYGIEKSEDTVCSGNGICLEDNTCKCFNDTGVYYSGKKCEYEHIRSKECSIYDSESIEWEEKCIKLFNQEEDKTFFQVSEKKCQKWAEDIGLQNGHLIQIKNNETNNFLLFHYNDTFLRYEFPFIGIGNLLFDNKWSDGSNISFTKYCGTVNNPECVTIFFDIIFMKSICWDFDHYSLYSCDSVMWNDGHSFFCSADLLSTKKSANICNGYQEDHPKVCNGHGECSRNECSCRETEKYSGIFCEKWKCGDYFNDDELVCSGKGTCTDDNTCECKACYGGDECEIKTVNCKDFGEFSVNGTFYKIVYNETDYYTAKFLCERWSKEYDLKNDNGTYFRSSLVSITNKEINDAIHENNLNLIDHLWIGLKSINWGETPKYWESGFEYGDFKSWETDEPDWRNAESYFCFLINTGNWNCSSYFQLRDMKKGYICEMDFEDYFKDSCFGKTNLDPNVCGGHGYCESHQVCKCRDDYYGDNCDKFDCYGIESTNSSSCGGENGTCISPNNCSCIKDGLYEDCTKWKCSRIENDNETVCRGNGQCVDVENCLCDSNHFGLECEFENKTTSQYCEESGGITLGLSCYVFIEGSQLNWFAAENNCLNMEKSGLKKFHLPYVYDKDVTSLICYISNNSLNDKIWIANETENNCTYIDCSDNRKWKTEDCNENKNFVCYSDLMSCGGYFSGHPDACNSHGMCNENGVCECDKEWAGELCETQKYDTDDDDDNPIDDDVDIINVNIVGIIVVVSVGFFILCALVILVVLFLLITFICIIKKKKRPESEELNDIETEEGLKLSVNTKLMEIKANDIHFTKVIGEGAGGQVFICIWGDKKCAFKQFKKSWGSMSTNFFQAFERELTIMASINHPHILQFFGVCLTPPRVGILMEYCARGDLGDMIGNGELKKMKEKIRILREICSGMKYLHDRSVIHRDLKPQNILITEKLVSKITDFGASRVVESADEKALMTKMIGTSYFVAPEVTVGKNYNEKCDTFSFSIIIWLVINEETVPYENVKGNIEFQVASKGLRPVIDKEKFKGVEWIQKVMEKCWDDNPKERLSFDEIITEFSQHLSEKELQKMGVLNKKEVKRVPINVSDLVGKENVTEGENNEKEQTTPRKIIVM